MSNIVIDIAAQFTGKKAFTNADRATQKLNKSVKNLAGAFGVAFSTRALVNYSKMAVKAFADDDKAARTLTQTLNNLGLAFADTEIKTFISNLEKQFGVLDDLLRPAYQKLITTTGDFRKSQDLLKVALDLSAQSGQDVVSVSNDLSQALIGNTKGLRKYNLGLTTAQLSAMSFEEILARITKISAGQAALAADTYAGKLDKLTVASENAKEVLGGALLDAIIKLGGGDVDKTTDKIDKLSTSLASLIRLTTGTSDMSLKDILQGVDYKFGFIPVNKVKAPRSKSPAGTFMRNQAEIKAAANAKKLAADQAKTTKALNKAQQDALKLAKAKAIFDLQKINIEAALKGKISAEDAIRLKLMKAIEEENLSNIDKYQKALTDAQTKTKELSDLLATVSSLELKDPFGMWSVDPLTVAINALTTSIGGVGTAITATGKEWSSFTGSIANTVLKPNLTEWSSSFSKATSEVTASLTTATDGITKTATDATASLLTTSKAANSILGRLYIDGEIALTDAADAATTDFATLATDTLQSVKYELAAVTAELAAAIAAASAQAAADAADLAGAGTSGFKNNVTVIVEGSVIAENDLATIVNDAINNSSVAGNAVGYNRTATTMAIA